MATQQERAAAFEAFTNALSASVSQFGQLIEASGFADRAAKLARLNAATTAYVAGIGVVLDQDDSQDTGYQTVKALTAALVAGGATLLLPVTGTLALTIGISVVGGSVLSALLDSFFDLFEDEYGGFITSNRLDFSDSKAGVDFFSTAGIDDEDANPDERIEGSRHGDVIYAQAGTDVVFGGRGADVLYGGGERDRLKGGNQDDTIYGGDGSRDFLWGGNGDDLLDGQGGPDRLYGGGGDDVLVYHGIKSFHLYGGAGTDVLWSQAAAVDLAALERKGKADGIENIDLSGTEASRAMAVSAFGSLDDNVITGNRLNNWLKGNAGADTLWGNAGRDNLAGQGGDDRLFGGRGGDTLGGGHGDDRLWGEDGHDLFIFDGKGADTAFGGAGDDVFRFEGGQDFSIAGGEGYDTLDLSGINGNRFDFSSLGDRLDGVEHLVLGKIRDIPVVPTIRDLTLTKNTTLTLDAEEAANAPWADWSRINLENGARLTIRLEFGQDRLWSDYFGYTGAPHVPYDGSGQQDYYNDRKGYISGGGDYAFALSTRVEPGHSYSLYVAARVDEATGPAPGNSLLEVLTRALSEDDLFRLTFIESRSADYGRDSEDQVFHTALKRGADWDLTGLDLTADAWEFTFA